MTPCHHDDMASSSSVTTSSPCGTDGALERMLRLGQRPKYSPAIFVHAGAGFHSHQNEKVHLKACVAAAEMGMKFLKAGATATEAIEASIRILEDKEITNAGYGSNLSIDGTVECDATIVDYLGRSGACGAVPNIRNPISLAKLILDTSNQPLSLRRVPPNALVGDGAKTFAEEHGMATFPNEYLVSKNARDRFLRWQEDLRRAEANQADSSTAQSDQNLTCVPCQYDTASPDANTVYPRDHAAAIMAGTWNEGQPDSPYAGTPNTEPSSGPESPGSSNYFRVLGTPTVSRSQVRATPERSTPAAFRQTDRKEYLSSPARSKQAGKKIDQIPQMLSEASSTNHGGPMTPDDATKSYRDALTSQLPHCQNAADGSLMGLASRRQSKSSAKCLKRPRSHVDDGEQSARPSAKPSLKPGGDGGQDIISDTVGAIAIDDKGQIAAGSSSGGIGMKHRGRLGPAALVGIGTAVVPSADDDEDGITVAAVTSGTGEHMATTMASQRCAERIYHSTRRGVGGRDVQDDDEDAIMESFITEDFMNHPGVRKCHSAGAIGVMVVKKTPTACYFYFAHNTDSFALASMGASEKQPVCTMSRLRQGAPTARGGRKVRAD